MTENVAEDDRLSAVNLRFLFLLKLVDLSFGAETGIFYLLSLFGLAYDIESIVKVSFQSVYHAGILLKLPRPVVYEGDVLRADFCRESEFVHLDR